MRNHNTLNAAAFFLLILAGVTHGQDLGEKESPSVSQTSDEFSQVARRPLVQQRGRRGGRWERHVAQAVLALLSLLAYWCNRNPKSDDATNEMFYALRRSDDWKWRGRLSADELLKKISTENMHGDWLVIPFASGEPPVTAPEFAENPDVFVERHRERLRKRKTEQDKIADQRDRRRR